GFERKRLAPPPVIPRAGKTNARRFLRAKAAVIAEGVRVGPASRGQRRNKPPRATASVVMLVSGRWERDDAGSFPEIPGGDSSRRVLPIVIRAARTTPGPMTLVIDLGYS